jgi:hypothetical protein
VLTTHKRLPLSAATAIDSNGVTSSEARSLAERIASGSISNWASWPDV